MEYAIDSDLKGRMNEDWERKRGEEKERGNEPTTKDKTATHNSYLWFPESSYCVFFSRSRNFSSPRPFIANQKALSPPPQRMRNSHHVVTNSGDCLFVRLQGAPWP